MWVLLRNSCMVLESLIALYEDNVFVDVTDNCMYSILAT